MGTRYIKQSVCGSISVILCYVCSYNRVSLLGFGSPCFFALSRRLNGFCLLAAALCVLCKCLFFLQNFHSVSKVYCSSSILQLLCIAKHLRLEIGLWSEVLFVMKENSLQEAKSFVSPDLLHYGLLTP